MADDELVRRVRAREAGAWESLVRAYERIVYAIPRRLGLGQADVEEVFQNTWLLVYEHVQHLRDSAKLRSWVATTARREAWRVHRRSRPAGDLETVEVEDERRGPEAEAELLEMRSEVRRGLATLREPCREVLSELFFATDRPNYAEVAERLGMPVGSLGPTRARCLADLARYLEQQGF